MIDRHWIAAHIPHQGRMCLLDAADSWSEDDIVCRATSHRQADNPLRMAGRLGIACGIEYAAQAMAVHGALLADRDGAPFVGYLASLRDIAWYRQRLDDVDADLTVRAERISGNASNLLYRFEVSAAGAPLLRGRASVILKGAA
jgi:predicted hotdog family 3-hydroxylacyl-ACP dehydratase